MIALVLSMLAAPLPSGVADEPKRTLVAAHRGIVGNGETENSLAAIRAAIAVGVDAIEIDLRTTADGEIVLAHDRSLAGQSRAELQAVDPKLATLNDALDLVSAHRTRLLIDLKQPGSIDPRRVVALVRQYQMLDRIIVGARSPEEVRDYRRLAPSIAILGFARAERDIAAFEAAGANIIRLWPRWMFAPGSDCEQGASRPCLVQRLQARGLSVWTTADAPDDPMLAGACFAHLLALRLDGVLTDRADLLKPLLGVSSAPVQARFPGLRRCTW